MKDTGSGPDARVRRLLQDLTDFGGDAAYTVSLGIDEFVADTPYGRLLRNNGRHILIQIATVVEKLPASFKQARPNVDWVSITRMRNLMARRYDKVDDRLVYTALQRRISDLLAHLGLDD